MNPNNEWKGRTGGGNFGQKSLFLYFRYGSIPLAYGATLIAALFYLCIHVKASHSIYSYFRKRQDYSFFKAIWSTYLNHFIFGKTLIDKFAVFAGRGKEYKIEIIGNAYFNDIINDGNKGAVIVNSHVGNAEIAGYLLRQNKKQITALVFGGEGANMQRYRNKVMGDNNIRLIPVVDAFSHFIPLYQAAQNHDLISAIGDRTYSGSKNTAVSFMGAHAFLPLNPFQIAEKLDLPVLAFFVMISGYKKYRIHVIRLDVTTSEDSSSKANTALFLQQQYVNALEEILQKYPLQWFNFYKFWSEEKISNNLN